MAEQEIEKPVAESTKAPAAKEKTSGNVIKRNQTSDNIEISLPGRLLRIAPYEIVTMNEAEWQSAACKPYHNILK